MLDTIEYSAPNPSAGGTSESAWERQRGAFRPLLPTLWATHNPGRPQSHDRIGPR